MIYYISHYNISYISYLWFVLQPIMDSVLLEDREPSPANIRILSPCVIPTHTCVVALSSTNGPWSRRLTASNCKFKRLRLRRSHDRFFLRRSIFSRPCKCTSRFLRWRVYAASFPRRGKLACQLSRGSLVTRKNRQTVALFRDEEKAPSWDWRCLHRLRFIVYD